MSVSLSLSLSLSLNKALRLLRPGPVFSSRPFSILFSNAFPLKQTDIRITLADYIGYVDLLNGTPTFEAYLIPKPSVQENSRGYI